MIDGIQIPLRNDHSATQSCPESDQLVSAFVKVSSRKCFFKLPETACSPTSFAGLALLPMKRSSPVKMRFKVFWIRILEVHPRPDAGQVAAEGSLLLHQGAARSGRGAPEEGALPHPSRFPTFFHPSFFLFFPFFHAILCIESRCRRFFF